MKREIDQRDKAQKGEEQADAERGPDLGEHGVLGDAEKALQLEVLLDPLEEQLDLPTAFVDVGDGLGRQMLDIGEEFIGSAGVGAAISDQSQGLERPGLFLFAGEFDPAIELDRRRGRR